MYVQPHIRNILIHKYTTIKTATMPQLDLARFITWIRTVYFFSWLSPVEVPIPKCRDSILAIHHDLVPSSAEGLTVDDARVKEVAP